MKMKMKTTFVWYLCVLSVFWSCSKTQPEPIVEHIYNPSDMSLVGKSYVLENKNYSTYGLRRSQIPIGVVVNWQIDSTFIVFDYGDSTGSTRSTTHVYKQAGTYTIRATVDSSTGRIYHLEKTINVASVKGTTTYDCICNPASPAVFTLTNVGEPAVFYGDIALEHKGGGFYADVDTLSNYSINLKFGVRFSQNFDTVYVSSDNVYNRCQGKRR
jgi:hypothetical protein